MTFNLNDFEKRDNRLVLKSLLEGDVLHERRVMSALGAILAGEDHSILGLNHKELGTQISQLRVTDRDCLILEIALALHDIGQRLNNEPHSESGYRVLKDNPQVQAAVDRHLSQWPAPRPATLSAEELHLVQWLVQHHDVLGNIYTGERKACYLNEIFADLREGLRERAQDLLFVVAVADFVGRSRKRLKRKRVDFWKARLRENEQQREAFPDLPQRIEQWTWGGPRKIRLGSTEHQSEQNRLLGNLTPDASRVLSQYISHITYGLYLLQWLDLDTKAQLLNRIADVYLQHFTCKEVTLRFAPPFRRGFSAAKKHCFCDAYVEALREDELRIVADEGREDITVELPAEFCPKEVMGNARHASGDSEALSFYLRKPTPSGDCRGTFKIPDGWSLTEGETVHLRLDDGRQANVRILELATDGGIVRFVCLAPL